MVKVDACSRVIIKNSDNPALHLHGIIDVRDTDVICQVDQVRVREARYPVDDTSIPVCGRRRECSRAE